MDIQMNLQECPTTKPSLHSRAPAFPLPDAGPEWIDAETVAGMAEQVQRGTVRFAYDPSELVDAVDKTVLEALFITYLHESPITSPYPLPHRVLALVRAIKHMIETSDGPAPLTLLDSHTVEVAQTTLELWLHEAAQALPERFTAAQREVLRDEVLMVSAKELADLTGIGAASLQQYRDRGVGPQYIRTGRNNTSIRYPVAAVIGWLYGYKEGKDNA